MTSQKPKPRNNRALTFEGANRIFEVVGIEITQHPILAIYEATYQAQIYQAKTLIEVCQQLILALQAGPSTQRPEQP
ncbi:MAG: hypothetical protein ACFBSF_21275 [Leptolyngbyaceae cyanobacterium]